MTDMPMMHQVKNMKTLAEALEVFTSEEVVSFKWDKQINADTGKCVLSRIAALGVYSQALAEVLGFGVRLEARQSLDCRVKRGSFSPVITYVPRFFFAVSNMNNPRYPCRRPL